VAGLAWVGLVTVTPVGQVGAALLLVGGLGLELADRLPAWGDRVGSGVRAVAILLVGTGALFAIQGGLLTEVVYTVAAAAALVAAAGSSRALQASTASAPRATAPSA
jgi:nucleoid-associated protein YgaU